MTHTKNLSTSGLGNNRIAVPGILTPKETLLFFEDKRLMGQGAHNYLVELYNDGEYAIQAAFEKDVKLLKEQVRVELIKKFGEEQIVIIHSFIHNKMTGNVISFAGLVYLFELEIEFFHEIRKMVSPLLKNDRAQKLFYFKQDLNLFNHYEDCAINGKYDRVSVMNRLMFANCRKKSLREEHVSKFLEKFDSLETNEEKIMLLIGFSVYNLTPITAYMEYKSYSYKYWIERDNNPLNLTDYERAMTFIMGRETITKDLTFKEWNPTKEQSITALLDYYEHCVVRGQIDFPYLIKYNFTSPAFIEILNDFTPVEVMNFTKKFQKVKSDRLIQNYKNKNLHVDAIEEQINDDIDAFVEIVENSIGTDKLFSELIKIRTDEKGIFTSINKELTQCIIGSRNNLISTIAIQELGKLDSVPESIIDNPINPDLIMHLFYEQGYLGISDNDVNSLWSAVLLLENIPVWHAIELMNMFYPEDLNPQFGYLNYDEWAEYVDHYDEYKDMPISWWYPLVKKEEES